MTKILIIEDENLLRGEVEEWLELEDYEVIGARNGLEGLQLARSEHPDLIISDITMPELDGFGVLLELNSDSITAGIPFIFVTARASHDDIRQGMTMGADDYITKPFTRLELLEAIDTRLRKKATHKQDFQEEIEYWQQAFEHEQTQRLLKAKMIGMFSHDFRNPLSVILSSIDLLRGYDDRLSPERKLAHMNKVEGSVRQLLQMLDDMLMVAKMEGDYLEYTPQSLDLSALVRSIIEDFSGIYIDSHVIHFNNQLTGNCVVDPKLIRNVVSNLLSNAIKYSPSGENVKVLLVRESDTIILQIQDKGIGIPDTAMQQLFEPFHRASNTGSIKGTGLGLFIVKRCVDLHDGELLVESAPGTGTTFTVKIPFRN